MYRFIADSIEFKLGFPIRLEERLPTSSGGIVRIKRENILTDELHISAQCFKDNPFTDSFSTIDDALATAQKKARRRVQEDYSYTITDKFASEKIEYPVFAVTTQGEILKAYFQSQSYDWKDIEMAYNNTIAKKPSSENLCIVM